MALCIGGLGATPASAEEVTMGAAQPLAPSAMTSVSQDPYGQLVEQAQIFMGAERYREALQVLEAAYARRQAPLLLLRMGVAQQRLGNAREAQGLYQRFLASGVGSAEERAAAEAGLRLVGGVALAQPLGGAALPLDRPVLPPSRRLGLMGGGASLFGVAYLGAVVAGALEMDNCRYASYSSSSRSRDCAMGATLLIPFAGPFISAGIGANATWSVPWALIDGVAQLGGLAMMIMASRQPARAPSPAGLIAGGASLFGTGYLGAVVVGSLTLGNGAYGGVLLIPVLGPFISAALQRDPTWVVSWTLADGVAQAGGMALMILGGVRQHRLARAPLSWQVAPLHLVGGSGLAISGRF